MAYSTKSISFLRLSTLLLDPGTRVVCRKLDLKITDTGLTFVQFINNRKHDLFHLYKNLLCCSCSFTNRRVSGGKIVITAKQWQHIFIRSRTKCNSRKQECSCLYDANPNAKVEDLDISFCVCLLIHLCPLSPAEEQDLKNLRDQRNDYFAHAKTPKVDTKNFSKMFQKVTSAIESIAYSCGHGTWKEFTEIIQQIKKDPVLDQDCLKISNLSLLYQSNEFTQEEIQEIKSSMERSQDKLNEMHRDVTEIKEMLLFVDVVANQPETQKASMEMRKAKQLDSKDDSSHSVKHRTKTRPCYVKRESSRTLPARIKDQGIIPGSLNDEKAICFDDLKSEEQHLLSRFIEECKTGDPQQVSSIANDLPQDCKLIHIRDQIGYRAIHHAAHRNGTEALDIIKELISRGAKPIDTTSDGMTILHIACKTGNLKICEFFIQMSEDPEILNQEDTNGWNGLLYAACFGHTDIVKFLASQYRKVNLKSSQTNVNILHLACLGCHIETCKYIMRTFPEIVHEVDHEGRTVAHYTARGGETKIMNEVLKRFRKTRKQFQRPSKGNRNPLHIACLYGNVEMCRKIISKFPFMLHETDDEGLHAVHYAAVGGHVKVMELLMEFLRDKIQDFCISATRDINILQMACVYGKIKMWCFITEKFPKLISAQNTDGWTIIHDAARSGNVAVLKILADDKKLDLDSITDSLERTALHIGCLYGKYEVCEFLVSKYPSMMNMKDVDGCRPVVLAAAGGNLDILKLLLENDSETPVTNTSQFTILHAAYLSSSYPIINFIEEKYPELKTKKDQYGRTPIDIGNSVENFEMKCLPTESARSKLSKTDESTYI